MVSTSLCASMQYEAGGCGFILMINKLTWIISCSLDPFLPMVRSFTQWQNHLPSRPILVRVVHTIGGVISSYRLFTKCPCPSTTVQDLYVTLCHNDETSNTLTHLMWPYYTEKQLRHNLMYTVDHTFRYRSKKFIHTCTESSMHA